MVTIDEILETVSRLPVDQKRRLLDELERRLTNAVGDQGIVARTPEMENQIFGDWYSPEALIPDRAPEHLPTAAILPSRTGGSPDDFLALDLVRVGDCWFPLSKAGRYTYAHSEGLLRGEVWRLVTRPSHETKAATYAVSYAESLESRDAVRLHYGDDAAQRSRPDRPIVQLRLKRIS